MLTCDCAAPHGFAPRTVTTDIGSAPKGDPKYNSRPLGVVAAASLATGLNVSQQLRHMGSYAMQQPPKPMCSYSEPEVAKMYYDFTQRVYQKYPDQGGVAFATSMAESQEMIPFPASALSSAKAQAEPVTEKVIVSLQLKLETQCDHIPCKKQIRSLISLSADHESIEYAKEKKMFIFIDPDGVIWSVSNGFVIQYIKGAWHIILLHALPAGNLGTACFYTSLMGEGPLLRHAGHKSS